jgi:hypothetical protein
MTALAQLQNDAIGRNDSGQDLPGKHTMA